ncbi:Hypothetical protein GLP15_2596 [Giardia lamblia P15]|uniref:USP domain-containing protein n=1 Tax=Giardia intestinalis (strain P15) TaxID=658858 RepID=E1F8S7_GIAIA|nr:Hypothetical protein GLP15_2596 [Giardia lamblia P15]
MNDIEQSTDTHVTWHCSGYNATLYSPSFKVKGICCHICWEGKRLLLRTFGPCIWIKQLSCKLNVQMTPSTHSSNSMKQMHKFLYDNFFLTSTFYEICSSDLLSNGVSFVVEIHYSPEPISPSEASQLFSPSMYIPGLTNQGMTCYINVILQALFSIPKFRYFVITSSEGTQCFLTELQTLFTEMLVNADALKTALCSEVIIPSLSSTFQTLDTQKFASFLSTLLPNINVQGDAQEFILFMFDQLRNTLIGPDIHRLFLIEGYRIIERKQKSSASTDSTSKDVVLQHDLFISVPAPSTGMLDDSLRTLFEEEKVTHNAASQTVVTYTIKKLPDVLIISLQRSIYNPEKAAVEKDMSPIKLSEHLDLSKIQGATEFLTDMDSKYILVSVVTHQGASNHGHYLAYVLPYLYTPSNQSLPAAHTLNAESNSLTDETLIGPSCNLSLFDTRCYRISDSHVSLVDLTKALSFDNQKKETIYMLFYLRVSAFQYICRSNRYPIEKIYWQQVQKHRSTLNQITTLSIKQYTRRLSVLSKKLTGVSSDGIITISPVSYEVPCFAGLEFLHNRGFAPDWSAISIYPLFVKNDKIFCIQKPLNYSCDITWPVVDIEREFSSSNRHREQTLWYLTAQKASYSSQLFFLILYLAKEDIILIRKLIAPMSPGTSLPSCSVLTSGCTLLEELITNQATKTHVALLAKRTFIKYVLEAYHRNLSDSSSEKLMIELNLLLYYKRSQDHQLSPLEQQTEPLTSGLLYLGLDWSNLAPEASGLYIDRTPFFKEFIYETNDRVELSLEPLELETYSSVGMHTFKLAGLFMMPPSYAVVQQIPLYLECVNKYPSTRYILEITPYSDLCPSMKIMVSPKCILEEISHDLYTRIVEQPLVRVIERSTKACVATVTYKEVIDVLQINLPECLQEESCALNIYKHDAYIHEKVSTPANEHVVFLSESSRAGSIDSQGKSNVLRMIGLFTINERRFVSTSQLFVNPTQRGLTTIEDILPKKTDASKLVSNSISSLSPTSLRRRSGFGPGIQRTRQSDISPHASSEPCIDERAIRLRYAFSRVPYSHIASVRPVRVLLVVHNLPITDLIIPMPREQGWQNIKMLMAQLRDFFYALFHYQDRHEYTYLLSLADVNGCICSFLEDLSLSLLTVRGNPVNINGILRCDICEKPPNAILYYKTKSEEYTGIGQILTVNGESPEAVISALHASHEYASLFLAASKRSPDMQATLNGYNPSARLLWVPQNMYSILQDELLLASKKVTSAMLFKTEHSIINGINRKDKVCGKAEIWTCRLQFKFSEVIPGDDRLLFAHTHAQKKSNL